MKPKKNAKPAVENAGCCSSKNSPASDETESVPQQNCFHCLQQLPEFSNIRIQLDGYSHRVCCAGCKAAAEFVQANQLTNFYRRRTESLHDSPSGSEASSANPRGLSDWSFLDDSILARKFVDDSEAGVRQLSAHLQGIYCSSCSWLISKAIGKLSEQIEVKIDLGSHRVYLRVCDEKIKLSELLHSIEVLGYPATLAALDNTLSTSHAPQHAVNQRNENRLALRRIAVAGFGMMQVMTYAAALYLGEFQGMDESYRRFLSLVSMLVATAVVLYAGQGFFQNAIRDLRNRHLGMDVPIALAIGGAYFPSVYEVLVRSHDLAQGAVYFDSAVMFVFFLLVGRYVALRAHHRLADPHSALQQMLPPLVKVQRTQSDSLLSLTIAPHEVQRGDQMLLESNQTVAFDARIDAGEALLDESHLSGESRPVRRCKGELVIAGSTLLQGNVTISASGNWQQSSLYKVEQLLTLAHADDAQQNRHAQFVAEYFIATVLLLTLITGVVWWAIAPHRVFEIVLAMLVASCPCAFALAAPIASASASKALRRRGLLLANFKVLRVLPKVTAWCFDKTGTLTRGTPAITEVRVYDSLSTADSLNIAAAIEAQNNHLLSSAFHAIQSFTEVSHLQSFAGLGVSAEIAGETYYLGKPTWVLAQLAAHGPSQLRSVQNSVERELGKFQLESAVGLASKTRYIATFLIRDSVRTQAGDAISTLHANGYQTCLLSGDRRSAVQAIAQVLQIDQWFSDLLPKQKVDKVAQLQQQGEVVAMVGDGLNDAPVMQYADVSIAMVSGNQITQGQADIILLGGNLNSLNFLSQIARKTQLVTRQNLLWASIYNVLVLPLAAFGYLTPWLAALGMSASSLLVVLNALRIGAGHTQSKQQPAHFVSGLEVSNAHFNGSTKGG